MSLFPSIAVAIDNFPHAALIGAILITVGSVSLALASIIKRRLWVTTAMILGGLLNLVGTTLTINSGDIRNQDSFVALTKIVAETNNKLDAALKAAAPGSQEEQAITTVRDEFEKSVEDFWASRDESTIDINPSQLDERSANVLINRQWRPIFEQALATMTKVIAAYNK